jgi:hypothetical protein
MLALATGFRVLHFVVVICFLVGHSLLARGDETIEISGIQPWEVVQRDIAQEQRSGADIRIQCKAVANRAVDQEQVWQYRILDCHVSDRQMQRMPSAASDGVPWISLPADPDATNSQGAFRIHLNAGGWYRLEIRLLNQENVLATGAIEPIGVGEVFMIAGQSYATNCNDERLLVQDAKARVSVWNPKTNSWGIANDPQPAPDGSDGGSIWPPFGDEIAKRSNVPVGLVNVAVGATSSHQWMPGGVLHQRLLETGIRIQRFRAVLWQQGESDVLAETLTAQYVANLQQIEKEASNAWRFRPTWFLAKSTHHPTVYNNASGEGQIRAAIDQLCLEVPFRHGPDTDSLQGENRGDIKSRRHFTGIGQIRAAALWSDAIHPWIGNRDSLRQSNESVPP